MLEGDENSQCENAENQTPKEQTKRKQKVLITRKHIVSEGIGVMRSTIRKKVTVKECREIANK